MSDRIPLIAEVERWLDLLYIAAEGASLRKEDRRKALEVAGMLLEIERAASRFSRKSPLVLVDAAAGKSYLGLLAVELILEPAGHRTTVLAIEKDPRRTEMSRRAAARLSTSAIIDCRTADVADPAVWPDRPSIVAALHACGPAADSIIDRTIACEARMLLLVPCCTSKVVAAAAWARNEAERRAIPRQAPVRRRFIQALVDAERTWRLEAAGYQTDVVEFVGATVTPHNLLWRSWRVHESKRMASAGRMLALLTECRENLNLLVPANAAR